tara:strand:- start:545 stop:784 length:240 start_codon:yes stop_codon:yes gene_type:complete
VRLKTFPILIKTFLIISFKLLAKRFIDFLAILYRNLDKKAQTCAFGHHPEPTSTQLAQEKANRRWSTLECVGFERIGSR